MNDVSGRGPRLRIIAINDVYQLDNFPRLATLLAELARVDPVERTLVTLAGDFLAPSLLSSIDQGRGMVAVLNAIGVTHVTFGNHEDDLDVDVLRERMAELNAVWLGSNAPDFRPSLPAFDIVTLGGAAGRTVRVGLIGVVIDDPTIYRRPPFGGTRLLPARQTARALATALVREQRIDLVVPLTHLPLSEDRLLAREQRRPPFRVILGGHDHSEMLEWIDGTCIAKAGHDAARAIVVEFEWAATASETADVHMQIRLEPVAAYAETPSIRALVDRHMAGVRAVHDATLMRLEPGLELSSIGSRSRQTSLGQMLCTRLRDVLGVQACLINGGGIRGARTYRAAFTFADLEAELPFDNEITIVAMRGDELVEVVKASRTPPESGGFLQVDDGVRIDPESQTIVAVAGERLDPARFYRVALMRNLLFGMDRIEPLMRLTSEHPERVPPEGCGREVKVLLVEAFGALLADKLGFANVDSDRDGLISLSEIAAANASLDGSGESA